VEADHGAPSFFLGDSHEELLLLGFVLSSHLGKVFGPEWIAEVLAVDADRKLTR
jgi:hypothetical protein